MRLISHLVTLLIIFSGTCVAQAAYRLETVAERWLFGRHAQR